MGSSGKGGGTTAAAPPEATAAFHMPSYEAPHAPQVQQAPQSTGPSYEEQEAARLQSEGVASRDDLYANYMDAASSATEFVNAEISREQSNAALLNIDYKIDNDMKSTRINDYFASIWGEGNQTKLESLMGEFGNPKGFSGFAVTRGDESVYAAQEGGEEVVGLSRGSRPTILTEDDEDTLDKPSVLGV